MEALWDRVTKEYFDTVCFYALETIWKKWYFNRMALLIILPLLNGSTQPKRGENFA